MIWFDLDNTPHVPLFNPIIKELKRRNSGLFVTARDFAQTEELLKLFNIDYMLVGKHAGKNKINKVINLFTRAASLKKIVKLKGPKLAVSHGSRTQLLAAKQLGIKSLLMLDYEYTESKIFNTLATNLLMPVYIPDNRLKDAGFNLKKIIRYNGFKEELYLKDFIIRSDFRQMIGITGKQILIVVRPPSMTGNYHDAKSEVLLAAGLKYFSNFPDAVCLIVNRTSAEKKFIKERFSGISNIKFLEKAVDGLQLLFAADIAVSGGGTMNRESALLGTETYSIFTGKRPYLDEYLQKQGKLTFIENPEDFKKITVERKSKTFNYSPSKNLAIEITELIINLSNQ